MLTPTELQRKRERKAERRRIRRAGYHQREQQRVWSANLSVRARMHNLADDIVGELAKKLGIQSPFKPRPLMAGR